MSTQCTSHANFEGGRGRRKILRNTATSNRYILLIRQVYSPEQASIHNLNCPEKIVPNFSSFPESSKVYEYSFSCPFIICLCTRSMSQIILD